MHSPVLPILSCFIITLLLMQSPASFAAEYVSYQMCRTPFNCATLPNISYPFWKDGRQDYCGHPSFKLNCEGSVPRITILSMTYRILQIDSSSQTLRIASEDLFYAICPITLPNTTIDFNRFACVSCQGLSVYFYFGCLENFTWPTARKSACTTSSTSITYFYVIGNASTPRLNNACKTSIVVPVDQTAAAQFLSYPYTASLKEALEFGFLLRWMANNTLCDGCIRSGGLCGHNPYSKSFACHCADRTYDYTCSDTKDGTGLGTGHSVRSKIAMDFSIGMAIIIVLSVATIYFKADLRWKKDKGTNQHVEDFFRNCGSLAPKEYSYSEIKRITNFFADKLGQGGYGSVFKGKLCDGRLVAVKVLSETKGNGEEFLNEVDSISRTSHVNVVNLLGFCYKGNKRALVYEFMPNGSLDKFICKNGTPNKDHLDWNMLYNIAVGIARGLEYLHRGCNTRIVHFDIKPHNILLDEEFFPKISDFGLARLCERKESLFSMLGTRGTPGYIAPEVFCRNFGGVSHKSDVYSYGMLVLEMVGLRRRIEEDKDRSSETYFPDWIYEHLELGKDLGLEGVVNAEEQEAARKMILVGLWCIQTKPSDRPSMSRVVEMLEGSLQSLQIPPKPFLYSPTAELFTQESGNEISSS